MPQTTSRQIKDVLTFIFWLLDPIGVKSRVLWANSGHWSAADEAVHAQLIQIIAYSQGARKFSICSRQHFGALEWKRY
jgi:hypothetical protein